MSEAKHTKGPLFVSVENLWPFNIVTKNSEGEVVFSKGMPCYSTSQKNAAEAISGKRMNPEYEAERHNRRAIADEVLRAAAPDLLEALRVAEKKLVELENEVSGGDDEIYVEGAILTVRAAIAKATGDAS